VDLLFKWAARVFLLVGHGWTIVCQRV
jgi:hypothetical protein